MPKKLLPIIIMLPLLFIIFMSNLRDISDYHADENLWIAVGSRTFQLYFIDHNFSDPFWKEDIFAWGAFHPQIGKYIIGFGTYLAGYTDVPFQWFDFSQNLQWNRDHGLILDTEIVQAARVPVALSGLFCCLLLYWMVTLTTDRWYGFAAVGSLIGAKLLPHLSRHAMIDIPA